MPAAARRQLFNLAALTPAMVPVDREYLYGSLDRKILDQYLEFFGDFKYVRGFWDGAFPPASFTPDVFTDATRPVGISRRRHQRADSKSVQSIHSPGLYVAGGFDPKHPDTKVSAAPPGTGFTTGVHYAGLEAGLVTDKITTQQFGVYRRPER